MSKYRLGRRCWHPETSEPAVFVGIVKGVPFGRTQSGTRFAHPRFQPKGGRKSLVGTQCSVRLVKGDFGPMVGERLEGRRVRIVSPGPLLGTVLDMRTCEIGDVG